MFSYAFATHREAEEAAGKLLAKLRSKGKKREAVIIVFRGREIAVPRKGAKVEVVPAWGRGMAREPLVYGPRPGHEMTPEEAQAHVLELRRRAARKTAGYGSRRRYGDVSRGAAQRVALAEAATSGSVRPSAVHSPATLRQLEARGLLVRSPRGYVLTTRGREIAGRIVGRPARREEAYSRFTPLSAEELESRLSRLPGRRKR